MERLLQAPMMELLDHLMTIKYYFDEGSDNVVNLFSNYDEDIEEVECDYYELLYNAGEFVNNKTVYYRDENGNIDENEPMYDMWFYSSCEMTEYYKFLNKLYRAGFLDWQQYSKEKNEMLFIAREYLLGSPSSYYNGINFSLYTKFNHKYASSINIYIDPNYCYSTFEIACSIRTLFDLYSQRLEALKKKYGGFNMDWMVNK